MLALFFYYIQIDKSLPTNYFFSFVLKKKVLPTPLQILSLLSITLIIDTYTAEPTENPPEIVCMWYVRMRALRESAKFQRFCYQRPLLTFDWLRFDGQQKIRQFRRWISHVGTFPAKPARVQK